MERLCTPAIIYVVFSVVQIIMDLYTGLINTAVVKFFIMIIMTILLNVLCQRDLAIISWIIVFIPFIMMTFIVSLILYIFGLSKATGSESYSKTANSKTAEFTAPANVYSPQTPYNPQPSIYPPAMGYPPANTYKPPATNKPASAPTTTSQPSSQSTSQGGYNYMNVSKFYPYPTNM
uniref:Uncharacterized protein n=1 Tax=viral metagenome TaxID=1070528 RepID=A0A6C0EEY6_9ZZZZ